MPRLRCFRDPRTLSLHRQKPRQLDRLLLSNPLRVTISRLPKHLLDEALGNAHNAHVRHVNLRGLERKDLVRSPNHGQVFAVKDNFVTRDLPTTCASNILEGYSAEDATAVRLLKDAGMAMVAKTNMDEFGMGSHSVYSAYGAVTNGSGPDASSVGGSSGGSALAVALGLVDCALGSDTGGSVRLPAAYTGMIGFKPSYGVVSRRGLIPYANSLDTVGFLGQCCLDVWILFGLLARYDSQDPTSLSVQTRQRISHAKNARVARGSIFRFVSYHPFPDQERKQRNTKHYAQSRLSRRSSGLRRIGVPVEYNIEEMHPTVRAAWMRTLSNLQYQGHDIVPVSLPSTQQALSAYYVLAPAEASSNLAKYDGVRYGRLRDADISDDTGGVLYSSYRGNLFGEEAKQRILLGSFTLSAGAMDNYFIQAQKVRRMVQSDFDMVFRMGNPLKKDSKINPEGVDYILCPTAPTPPPRIEEVKRATPFDSYVNDVFTVPASLAGLPAISVPAHQEGKSSGDSESAIGVQVIGQFGDDTGVIHFAKRWLEQQQSPQTRTSSLGRRPRFK